MNSQVLSTPDCQRDAKYLETSCAHLARSYAYAFVRNMGSDHTEDRRADRGLFVKDLMQTIFGNRHQITPDIIQHIHPGRIRQYLEEYLLEVIQRNHSDFDNEKCQRLAIGEAASCFDALVSSLLISNACLNATVEKEQEKGVPRRILDIGIRIKKWFIGQEFSRNDR